MTNPFTTSQSIEAIRQCREAGLVVKGVVVLVDREEDDGIRNVQEAAGAGR